MADIDPLELYRCTNCGYLTDDSDMIWEHQCCQHGHPEAVDGFQCLGCGEMHTDENAARACCPESQLVKTDSV